MGFEMLENIEKVIRDYLPQIIHMSLATSKDNKPWVCEVHFAYDDKLNLYFRSKTSTRHSKEISENKFVAGNIVKQHGSNDAPRGVYFEGTCELLNVSDENDIANQTYIGRFGGAKGSIEEAQKEDGHKFYKVTVSKFYVFDARESKPSQKYELEWIK